MGWRSNNTKKGKTKPTSRGGAVLSERSPSHVKATGQKMTDILQETRGDWYEGKKLEKKRRH